MSRRALLRRGAGGVTGLALAGLWPGVGSAASRRLAATPTLGGTLKFARSVAPTELDPANSIIAGDVYTLDKIFEPLYVTSPAGQLTPWLSTGYTTSKDQKTFTFALRAGVKFSDGKPLTPADVVFSINRARKDSQGPLSFLDSAISSIEPGGSHSVVIQLAEA
jgi:peptide/nickel transport system substrate-binding protein